MLTIKNCQILLYCHFNKIIKEPGTCFQFPVQSQKHVRNVCLTTYQYLTKFLSHSTQDSKELSINGNSTTNNAYDDVTDFKICGFYKSKKNLDRRILRSKGMYVIFQRKDKKMLKKVKNTWKFGQKCTSFENILKKRR